MLEIKYVQISDREFWYSLDKHLPATEFDKKVRDKMGYVLWKDGRPAGLLRYHLFWDNTPFLTLIYVDKNFQGRGYGKKLLDFWEAEMKRKGYGMLMVSTQVNETSQHFYRKSGYRDCGCLVLDVPGHEQPMEMFMVKPM